MTAVDEAVLNRHDRVASFEAKSFSLSNSELLADPYPYYRKILSENPVHHSRMYGGSWVLFGYEDVRTMLCDPRLTNDRSRLPLKALPVEERQQFSDMLAILAPWVAFFDGESHIVRRRSLNEAAVALFHRGALAEIVRDVADSLMRAWDGRPTVDLVEDFTRPLPALVMARLLGAPEDDHRLLTAWSDDIAYLFGASDLTVADVRRGQRSVHAFRDYLAGLAARVLAVRPDSILGRLLSASGQTQFRFDDESAIAQCMLLMFAGLEPTRYMLPNVVWALHVHPDQRRLLGAGPNIPRAAMEEFLRYCTPGQYVGRMAAESFPYKGNLIEKGQVVMLYVGSANRDPEVFDDPDTLDLRRWPNRHLTFGIGQHNCIGSTLVREQLNVGLSLLLTRYPDFRVSPRDRPVWNSNLGFHGPTSLMIDLTN
jgi:cytochrome P450